MDEGEKREKGAALYIRLSKEDEREGISESVVNQKSLLDTFAGQKGFYVYDTYIDDGWSGLCFERPAFGRMIRDIEAQRVDTVITKDLSRLGRDYIMTGYYIERYFPEKGVRYLSILDGIDTATETTANELTPFRAILNDFYAKDISKKIKSVKRDKQRKGEFIGGKPMYGYKMHPTEKNRIVADEAAATVVRRIFALALGGMSCRRIARVLNEAGIATPAVYCGWRRDGGGLWSGERIAEMLRNETYIGNMVQGRREKISYKSKKCIRREESEWVIVANTHEALVDEKSFRRVGELLESRRQTRSRRYDFLFKGMIFCHECGHPLGVINRKTAGGEDRLFFICRTYQRFTQEGRCSCHCIKEEVVREAVLERLREVILAHADQKRLREIAVEALRAEGRERAKRIEALRGEIYELTGDLERMYRDRLRGLLEEADFARMYRRMRAERDTLEGRLREAEEETEDLGAITERAEEAVRRFLDVTHDSRALAVGLIARMELTEEKEIIVQFRFPETDFLRG